MSVNYRQTRERYRQIMADALEDAREVVGAENPSGVPTIAAAIFEQLVLHERDATYPGINPITQPPSTVYRPPKLGGP